MNPDGNTTDTFRVLPLQVIAFSDGYILRRGSEQFTIVGAEAGDLIRVLGTLMQEGSFSLASVTQMFSAPDQEKVKFIIRQLARRGMVVADNDAHPEDESAEDVFYWNYGSHTQDVVRELNDLHIALVGVGQLCLAIAGALANSGLRAVKVVDDLLLRTQTLFKENTFTGAGGRRGLAMEVLTSKDWISRENTANSCLIACSDFGGRQLLLPWNEVCVEKNIAFLPVVIKDFTGWTGPLVIPGETPCFQCLCARQNMHLEAYETLIEDAVSKEQIAVAGHPVMYGVLANLAVMRLLGYLGKFPTENPDHVLELDFNTGRSESRRVLKIPRCPVCSTLNSYPETDLLPVQPLPK